MKKIKAEYDANGCICCGSEKGDHHRVGCYYNPMCKQWDRDFEVRTLIRHLVANVIDLDERKEIVKRIEAHNAMSLVCRKVLMALTTFQFNDINHLTVELVSELREELQKALAVACRK